MHGNTFSKRPLRRLALARTLVFFVLAVAVAAPSHAGWFSRNRGSPPTISGTPPTTAVVGQQYAFRPSASDPDGDRLSFRIRNMPAWARFDASTGLLTGTPTSSSVGTYSRIQIRVSDGKYQAYLPTFSITVAASTAAAPAPAPAPEPAPAPVPAPAPAPAPRLRTGESR